MMTSLEVIVIFMTACGSLLSVMGNTEGDQETVCTNPPENQTARLGGSVNISCKYQREEEDTMKSFCRADGDRNCKELISVDNSEYTIRDRFSIKDDRERGVYTVNISKLTLEDAGIYQCTMKRIDEDSSCLTEIHLQVIAGMQTTTVDGNGSSNIGMIVGIVVCSALLVVAVVILILYKQKLLKVTACCAAGESSEQRTDTRQNTEGNNGDHHYEEIQLQNQQVTSLPTVYATVNPPPDLLHYASVNIHNDGNTLPAVISGDQGATRPPQAAEATLYSTVTPRVEQ